MPTTLDSRFASRPLVLALGGLLLACSGSSSAPKTGSGGVGEQARDARADVTGESGRDAGAGRGGTSGSGGAAGAEDAGAGGVAGATGGAGSGAAGSAGGAGDAADARPTATDAGVHDSGTPTDSASLADTPSAIDARDAAALVGLELGAALRFQKVALHLPDGACVVATGSSLSSSPCGASGQSFRTAMLGPDCVAIVDDATGQCVTVSSAQLKLADCTNAVTQQFSFSGSASAGYRFTSLSGSGGITDKLGVGSSAASIVLTSNGAADPLAVVVDERPVGWATMEADIIVPDAKPASGDESKRHALGTTGGGTWEAAKAKAFSNVTWFKPVDFAGSGREAAISNLQKALKTSGPSVILLEAGDYDFSLSSPSKVNSCVATCASGATYPEVGGFCPNDTDCAKTSGCKVGGYADPYRTLDVGSDKTILGLGTGARFKRLGLRFMGQHNVIYRNASHADMPGLVRAWDDGLLFWPADHVWVDHVSFAGFGRGAVVLSGTRVPDGSSFYTYRDSGWFTFSWLAIDSRETWRCNGSDDSPYPFFTTNDPALTFHHVLFRGGHGRNPAIDGEGAHFYNTVWSAVQDGLDGRGYAQLLVEGSYFDGDRPIRMDDERPPTVRAPSDAKAAGITDTRQLNSFSTQALASLKSDWASRKLDVNALNTNTLKNGAVAALPPYPYSLDKDPSAVLTTVTKGAGVGNAGFPSCTVKSGNKDYTCP